MLEVKGFLPASFLDYSGKISSVVFIGGCNFRCPFCQNWEIALHPERVPSIPYHSIEEPLIKHQDWLEAVVLGGGEPTIHKDLPSFIRRLKGLAFPVKLDTNASSPSILTELIKGKLIDYVAVDIKAPLQSEKYRRLAGIKVDLDRLKETISMVLDSGIDYELRTTFIPGLLSPEDIEEICRQFSGAKRYVLQNFRPAHAKSKSLRKIKPLPQEELEQLAKKVQRYIKNTSVR